MARVFHGPEPPRVQFVSKPIAPPFRDGSKCLVRDLCLHLSNVEPHVLSSSRCVEELGERVVSHAIYKGSGAYAPSLSQNLRAAAWMLMRSRAELWHFVFAPHLRASQVGAALKAVRRVPTVQTIASPPRSFRGPEQLLFGDVVVTQSEWTKQEFLSAACGRVLPEIVCIPPPAPDVVPPTKAVMARVRAELNVEEHAPLFLYPGDLEISQGADNVVSWAPHIVERVPGARVVIAYRDKTKGAVTRATQLRSRADDQAVRFLRNASDILALVATSTAILFPVEDLYGKVDLPIVLLEALRLGTPVLALNRGTLRDLRGAVLLDEDAKLWLEQSTRLACDPVYRAEVCASGRRAVSDYFDAGVVAKKYERIYERLLDARDGGRPNLAPSRSSNPRK